MNIDEYLPTFNNKDKFLDRLWIWNIGEKMQSIINKVNTLIQESFGNFVKEKFKANNTIQLITRRQETDIIQEFENFLKKLTPFQVKFFKTICIRAQRKIQSSPSH